MNARIVSINIGTSQTLKLGQRSVPTGIFKQPVAGRVRIGRLGVAGDEQLDRRYHGGPDKAVNVYPGEHFAYWRDILTSELVPGSFGENLTTAGLTETEVAIGDVLRIGGALLQVTQPRQPCGKLAARHHEPKLVKMVYETGKTGFYLRCLEPGSVGAEDVLQFVDQPSQRISVIEALRIMDNRSDREGVDRLLRIKALSEAWREELAQRPA